MLANFGPVVGYGGAAHLKDSSIPAGHERANHVGDLTESPAVFRRFLRMTGQIARLNSLLPDAREYQKHRYHQSPHCFPSATRTPDSSSGRLNCFQTVCHDPSITGFFKMRPSVHNFFDNVTQCHSWCKVLCVLVLFLVQQNNVRRGTNAFLLLNRVSSTMPRSPSRHQNHK